MKKVTLSIEGMTCSACSNGLEKYLNKQTKIKKATVNLVMATALIEYDDSLTLDDLAQFISEAGFKSLGIADYKKEKQKSSKKPLIIYGALALFAMYISMSHMLNLPTIPFFNPSHHPKNYCIILIVLTIPFLIYGIDILKNGIKNLLHRLPNMDTLVGIGVLSSLIYSLYSTIKVFQGDTTFVHNLYFESIAFVIYFIKLGRFIDKTAHEETSNAIRELATVTPQFAKIKTSTGIKEITIDEVKKGDILICLAGDKVAVDGIITSGETHTDESFITGESKPIKKTINDKVIAGSINYDGVIEYKAEKIGINSTISEIVKLVIEATNSKAPISLYADKICSYFVPTIIIISLLTLFISLFIGTPFNISLTRFVTVLVVACPCALGLATPLAIVVSEGLCASSGLLVKSSATLEQMNKIDTIVFDKTGTLTNGNLTISEFYNFSIKEDNEVLSILGSIESTSTHPIAKGILNYLTAHKIKYQEITTVKNIPGKGLKGTVGKKTYYLGNNKIIKELDIQNKYQDYEKKLATAGNSIIYIIENKTIIGLVGVKDTVRTEAKELIKELTKRDIDIYMLTGDNQETAESIGASLGIKNIIANVLPQEKNKFIQKLKKENRVVAMVGDGINDAPSLVASDIGISISSGTDIANDSANVILINNDLTSIIKLINISAKTLKIIKQNLFWAFLYNICMIPIAAGLFTSLNITINPMIASLAMILSSLFVALNALRLKK